MANSKKQNITITAGLAVLVSVGGGVLAWDRIESKLHGSFAERVELEIVDRKVDGNIQYAGENRLNLLNIMLDRKKELLAKINLAISTDGSNPALRASKQDIESSIRQIVASISNLGGV